MDWFQNIWAQVGNTFLGSFALAVGVLVAIFVVLAAPGGVAFISCVVGLAYVGYRNWGFLGTLGGIILGAFVGMIAYAIVDGLREAVTSRLFGGGGHRRPVTRFDAPGRGPHE